MFHFFFLLCAVNSYHSRAFIIFSPFSAKIIMQLLILRGCPVLQICFLFCDIGGHLRILCISCWLSLAWLLLSHLCILIFFTVVAVSGIVTNPGDND